MTPEGKVKQAVKKELVKADAWHYMPVQNGMGTVGIPDLIACVPVTITPSMVGKTIGVFFAVETKAPGKIKNTTPNQRRNLQAISEACGAAIVSDNAEAVERALSLLKASGTALTYIPVQGDT